MPAGTTVCSARRRQRGRHATRLWAQSTVGPGMFRLQTVPVSAQNYRDDMDGLRAKICDVAKLRD